MEEREVLRQAQRGDAQAFEQLATPYERRLYAVCLRMMGSPESAQDAMQDGMLRLWRGLAGFQTHAQFGTWAYRVMTNACLDALRKQTIREASSLEALEDVGFSPPDPGQTPEEALEAADRRQAIQDALQALAPDARAALVLRDIQGESYEAAAEALGVSLGTVKSRIHRAREKMAALLAQNTELFGRSPVQPDERRRS